MSETIILKNYINNLRNYLKQNSINENTAKHLEYFLSNNFNFITNLTFKKEIDKFQRVTINSRVNDGKEIRITDINKLKYPPNGALTNGRANLAGEKILYGTDNIITALKEARAKEKDLITISTWKLKTNKAITFTPIFKNFPLRSNVINIDFFKLHLEYKKKLEEYDVENQKKIDIFIQFLTDCFTKQVDDNNHFDYYLSAHYANRLFNFLDDGKIDAILYPSVKEDLMTTNVAMKHTCFDDNYELIKVEEKRVRLVPFGNNSYCELDRIKISTTFDKGKIVWGL
nr:hypothetical protein [uncultured Flavobacterium sp.]